MDNYSLPVGYQVLVGMTSENAAQARKILGKQTPYNLLSVFAQIPKLGELIIFSEEGRDKEVFRVDLVILRDVTEQGYAGDASGIDKSIFYKDQVVWAYIEVSYVKTIQFQDYV